MIKEDLLLEDGDSRSRKPDFWLSSDRGRMNDTVRDLLSARFSTNSSFVGSFFSCSGSLYSSFPLLSEAKNSSPRPKTTCKLAKSLLPAWEKRKSWRSGGRSWPSAREVTARSITHRSSERTLSIRASYSLPTDIVSLECTKGAHYHILQTFGVIGVIGYLTKTFI